ncbi:MAG: hypothetical protein D3924_08545 [Candidatus Electrothrix sp. AR4]|nr:hypothetical protein [Candidatus Electrothrix sp. AR4]
MINRRNVSSDAALALPVDTMNTEYRVTTYLQGAKDGTPEFIVVAENDATTVTITPPGEPPTAVVLNRGEGYFVHNDGDEDSDLTGTKISADKPVGMTNGNRCVSYDGGFCDHIFEVAPPVQTWGNMIPVANIPETPLGVRYKILASRDNTDVLRDGSSIATLNSGEYILTDRLSGDHIFSSEYPIFVAQFMENRKDSGGDPEGDPSMGNMTPAEQYMTNYTFSTVGEEQFIEHNVTIIAQLSDVGSLLLDESTVDASLFTQIGTSDYWVARILLDEGVHSTESANPHGITVEGFNKKDSYLYTGGAKFDFINPIGDTDPPECWFDNTTGFGTAEDNRPSEDTNSNGILDPGEDLNGNGLLDEDTGIFSVELGAEAVNLTLTVDPFAPGDGDVSFSADLTNNSIAEGQGIIRIADGVGNICEAPVELRKNKPPKAVCKDIAVALQPDGRIVLSASDIDNGSSDPEQNPITFNISKANFDCSDIGARHAVTLTVTDDNSTSDTCAATVTVADTVPPVVLTQDTRVQIDTAGRASIIASDIDAGSSDACGIASFSVNPSSFSCS